MSKKKKNDKVEKIDDDLSIEDDDVTVAVEQSTINQKKTEQRKKRIKYGSAAAFAALLGYGIYLLFVPYKGTMGFGVCKVFLEQVVQYPTTLRLSKVEQFPTSVRIWYTQIDSFGEYRLEPIHCFFREDDNVRFAIDRVTIRRREIDPRIVERFNTSLPVIFASPPDLDLPFPLPDSLRDLKIDVTRYLKPIL